MYGIYVVQKQVHFESCEVTNVIVHIDFCFSLSGEEESFAL